MAKVLKYTENQLSEISKKLQTLPQKDTSKNKFEAIRTLYKDVEHALKQGYSFQDICELLKEEGMNISAATLKSYLQKTRTNTKTKLKQEKNKNNDINSTSKQLDENIQKSSSGGFGIKPDIENL